LRQGEARGQLLLRLFRLHPGAFFIDRESSGPTARVEVPPNLMPSHADFICAYIRDVCPRETSRNLNPLSAGESCEGQESRGSGMRGSYGEEDQTPSEVKPDSSSEGREPATRQCARFRRAGPVPGRAYF
jgi:hypothetical protein